MASQYSDFEQYTTAQTDADGANVAGTGEGATFYGRIAGVAGLMRPMGEGREASANTIPIVLQRPSMAKFENGIGWDVATTYSNHKVDSKALMLSLVAPSWRSEASVVTLVERALDTSGDVVARYCGCGQGGCLYYNPLSNAIQTSYAQSVYGYVNPDYDAAVANSAEVLAVLRQQISY